MKHLLRFCVLLLLFGGCKKNNNNAKVEIFMLESFTVRADPSTNPPTVAITNAVLAGSPLVADADISFYTKATTTFKLKRDIRSIIQNYSSDKGFAITVDGQPVYYGLFRPAYLSSVVYGVATIDPVLYSNNDLVIGFTMLSGSTTLQGLDLRNDARITDALSASGRLR